MSAAPPASTLAPTPAAAKAGSDILYSVEGGVGLVTFNRPQARNALTFVMYDRLIEICRGVGDDPAVKVLVVTGAGGKAFAAGTDIGEFRVFETPEQGIAYEENAGRVFQAIESCPVPIIAAITGACTGGGAGIAACSDIRIASRDIKYGFPIARTLGNCLSSATLARLVGLLGQAKVLDMILTSRLLEAEEAHRIGLVNELVDGAEQVLPRAMALANQIAGHAPLTMRVTKEILRRQRQAMPKVEDHDLVGMIYTSADFREGMDAFLTKRKPQWRGR
jgi:enoyl-CoA hydratase